jgi:hypothetical protein
MSWPQLGRKTMAESLRFGLATGEGQQNQRDLDIVLTIQILSLTPTILLMPHRIRLHRQVRWQGLSTDWNGNAKRSSHVSAQAH